MLEEQELFYLESPEMLQMLRKVEEITSSLNKKTSNNNNTEQEKNSNTVTATTTTTANVKRRRRNKFGVELKRELLKRCSDLVDGNLLTIVFTRSFDSPTSEQSSYIDLEQRLIQAIQDFDQDTRLVTEDDDDDDDDITTTKTLNNSKYEKIIDEYLDLNPQPGKDLSVFNYMTNSLSTCNSKNFSMQISKDKLAFKVIKTSKTYHVNSPSIAKTVVNDHMKQINFYDILQTRK